MGNLRRTGPPADRARRAPNATPPFLLAAFHPGSGESAAEARNPGALVSFLRRTPDPTLQLVRASLLDGLAHEGRDLSGEIGRANFAAVSARTPAALDASFGTSATSRRQLCAAGDPR